MPLCLSVIVRGDNWTPLSSTQIRLASGRVVEYAVHLDRNALEDGVRVRDGLIAPIKPLSMNGPPWLLLDQFRKKLWRLDHGATRENALLTRVQVESDAKSLAIHDGIPWSDGTLLLATELGPRAYAPATRKLSKTEFPEPPQSATALVRDGLGRVWLLAGEQLWLSEQGTRTPENFERVPWVSQGKVSAIAADPRHADGVIVALGSRGVAFVRAHQKP